MKGKTHEAQSDFQGEGRLGSDTGTGDGGGADPAPQGPRESDLQVEAAAIGDLERAFESENGTRADGTEREAELLQKSGELAVERDFLSRGLGRLT